MNALTFALALIASLASTPAPKHAGAGIIPVGRIETVRPTREPRFTRTHRVATPAVRFVDSAPGCTTRTLAGDAAGVTVSYCN